MLRPQNGRTRFVTQDEYDKSLISPSHQKLAGDLLQKDDELMKFQLKAGWMPTTGVAWMHPQCVISFFTDSSSGCKIRARIV
jgi:hypothetical protein